MTQTVGPPTSRPWTDRVALVTGGGSGIGRALALRWAQEGARVVVVDVVAERAHRTVADLPGEGHVGDVTDVTDAACVARLVERVENTAGPVAVAFSNAGINRGTGIGQLPDWTDSFAVNVLGHVHLAEQLVPRMLARGGGTFVVTASAAGLLTSTESAPYTASKHAAVAFAEWLAIRYGAAGLRVSCVCPQGVRTAMNAARRNAPTGADGFIDPEDVADAVATAVARGEFLVLPHPEVARYEQRRVADRDRWLAAMGRRWARATSTAPEPSGSETR